MKSKQSIMSFEKPICLERIRILGLFDCRRDDVLWQHL